VILCVGRLSAQAVALLAVATYASVQPQRRFEALELPRICDVEFRASILQEEIALKI
jgi:hypothetical protein